MIRLSLSFVLAILRGGPFDTSPRYRIEFLQRVRESIVKKVKLWAVAGAFFMGPLGIAIADDQQACNDPTNVDRQIPSCTRVLASPGLSSQYRSVLLSNRGNAWSSKGEYQRAMSDYDAAIRIDPRSSYAYYNRGILWNEKLNRPNLALADFTEFIRVSPNKADGYAARGEVLYKMDDYASAIMDFDEAIRLDSTNAVYFGGRGDARRNQGDFDLALADFSEALRLNPEVVPVV